ncbi:MAG TPA: AraC family transcriptional regulator [Chitinophagaceae bacterium]|nr:AraC family transcriptional regulator [Chitinophagaceae bacterium]
MINYYELVKNNPDYFKQFSCKDLLFLNYDCPVKEKKLAKWSEHHYIYYVLSGKKTLHTLDGSVTLTTGSIALVKKGACIIEQFYEEPFCIVVFIMPDSFILSFLKDYAPGEKAAANSTSQIIPVSDDVMIRAFYQSIIPYFVSTEQPPEEILELKFKELLLHILHNPENAELKNFFLSLRDQVDSPIQEIMEKNYAYNLGIGDYARMTNRSVSSFKRDFQTLYKTTPGRWIMDKKLALAKRRLVESGESIASVAFESGFENTAHFSRLFKQKTGITPMEYRKKTVVQLLSAV